MKTKIKLNAHFEILKTKKKNKKQKEKRKVLVYDCVYLCDHELQSDFNFMNLYFALKK